MPLLAVSRAEDKKMRGRFRYKRLQLGFSQNFDCNIIVEK